MICGLVASPATVQPASTGAAQPAASGTAGTAQYSVTMAARVCPNGYRVLDQRRYKTDPDTGTQTDWVIRCL